MWLESGNLQNMARLEAGLPRGCSSSRWNTTAWGWILSGAAGGQKSTGTLTLLPPRIRRTMQGAPPSESRWGMTDLNRKTWTRPAGSRRSTRACRTAAGPKGQSRCMCANARRAVAARDATCLVAARAGPPSCWTGTLGNCLACRAVVDGYAGVQRAPCQAEAPGAHPAGSSPNSGQPMPAGLITILNYLPTHATILCNMPLAMPSYATVSRRFQGSYLHASVGVEA